MQNTHHPLSLPTPLPTRSRTLNVRLSKDEHAALEALAAQQGVTISTLARHFLLQALAYHSPSPINAESAVSDV